MRTLILGIGNRDRQDDGVACHILVEIQKRLNFPDPNCIEETFDSQDKLVIVFQLQLTPEMAAEIASFDRICFLDAHTGSVPEDLHVDHLAPIYQHSPLTHHLTASSLLSILQTIYNKNPEAILVSVKGHEFGYSEHLSLETSSLVPRASQIVIEWLNKSD